MEEKDSGGSESPSPGERRKGSVESTSEVVPVKITEKKADTEDDTAVCDKETREGGGNNSSSDGVTESEQLMQQLENCRKQIQVEEKKFSMRSPLYKYMHVWILHVPSICYMHYS